MFACVYQPVPPSPQLLAACAAAFSPETEHKTPATVVFDVSRLHRLYGSDHDIAGAIAGHAESLQLNVQIALAAHPEIAILAARCFPGVTVIAGEAATALAELSIDQLPLDPDLWNILQSWGVRTFGDFARLPEAGLAERFGQRAVDLRQLALGLSARPLDVQAPPITYEERIPLDHPIELLEPLLFILGRILNTQCERLQAHGMAASGLHLRLELEDGGEHIRKLSLPLPMRQSAPLLKLLHLDLEAHPPHAPMMAVTLALAPARPRIVQGGIFLPVTPAPDKLELTLARIRAVVGQGNAGVPELLNTHRPGAFHLVPKQPEILPLAAAPAPQQPRVAFRYFQPPLGAQVQMEGRQPVRLAAPGIRGNVLTCAGPWLSSGDWWTEDPWNREEWDVSLNDGAIYRIYREPDARWFIEGAYD